MTEEIREHPLLMQAGGIVATLDGRKIETRRTTKLEEVNEDPDEWYPIRSSEEVNWSKFPATTIRFASMFRGRTIDVRCPYGKPGERLWFRESFAYRKGLDSTNLVSISHDEPVYYPATKTWKMFSLHGQAIEPMGVQTIEGLEPGKGRPSIHINRWAARILVEILSIRVERVRDISEAGAVAEGISGDSEFGFFYVGKFLAFGDAIAAYLCLWDSINEKKGLGFLFNPWCWVVRYRRLEP